jgi:2-polyprenyl-3-methyl-5-hydroxy-6-metoxy-1,4-benzoquinol methylase
MDEKADELAAVIAGIRDRVRARNPNGVAMGDVVLPDLTPLLHARDAADAKVASIGTVNPRRPGLVNSIAQGMKRLVSRALDWHVREQVEFNRAVMGCVQSTLEALNECNRSMLSLSAALSSKIEALRDTALEFRGEAQQFRDESQLLRAETQELKDIRIHWNEWRVHWEKTLANTEIQFLRSVAELQASFQHRVTVLDSNFRDQAKGQHAEFEAALARTVDETQHRFWMELDRVRAQYETIIHNELRLLRQKASLARAAGEAALGAPAGPAAPAAPAEFADLDWLKFAEKFRGSESAIADRQRMYAARFAKHATVLDIGCGRGEMLEAFREAGIAARGVDLNDDSIVLCLSKGLDAEKADVFEYLNSLPNSALGGAVCSQVVEHLKRERVPLLIRLLHEKLRPGALVAFETPNPECLAIFATHFYVDPTHRHPIPASLLSFYLEEAGFGRLEVERLSEAIDSLPSLAELPEAFRKQFFGGLDYVVFATKLG